MGDDIRD